MDFLESVLAMLFSADGLYSGNSDLTVFAFAIASSFFGMLVVILDFLMVKTLNKNSLLKLSYIGIKGFFVFIMWGVGSGIGGCLGAAIGIFEINRIAAVAIGVAWPLVLPRLLTTANSELSTEKVELE